MSSMDVYTFDDGSLLEMSNNVFDAAIDGLLEFGELTPEHAEHIQRHYVMLIGRKGLFGRIWDSWFSKDATRGAVVMTLAKARQTDAS